jgi:uncharacterized DUF497 family protein
MSPQSTFEDDSETLRRVTRDQGSQYLLTEHAASMMRARGISLADIQVALQNGLVISDEHRINDPTPRWLVRGKTSDGADIELVVSVSEPDKAVRVVTMRLADVLEEIAGSSLTRHAVERRVDDWGSRIEALYNQIEAWLPPEWSADRRGTVEMHEELMQRFNISPRELPKLNLLNKGKIAGSIEPRGLWIIGANGRLDFSRGRERNVIVDTAESFAAPQWYIAPLTRRQELQPLDREAFLSLL